MLCYFWTHFLYKLCAFLFHELLIESFSLQMYFLSPLWFLVFELNNFLLILDDFSRMLIIEKSRMLNLDQLKN